MKNCFCRVPCMRRGGVRLQFQGNGYWLLVYVMNVGGGGDVASMWVKGSKTSWISMSHNWGASYQAFATLGGQSLSFKLTSYTSKETIYAWNVAPPNWNVGLTYQAKVNFHWLLNFILINLGNFWYFAFYLVCFHTNWKKWSPTSIFLRWDCCQECNYILPCSMLLSKIIIYIRFFFPFNNGVKISK